MKTKFTKGEWSYKPDEEYPTTYQIWNNFGNKFPTYIAHTCYAIDSEANAKLIASAPCLLEALQYIINDIKPEDACRGKFESFEKSKAYVGSKRMPTDEAIIRCIEAIKKATE